MAAPEQTLEALVKNELRDHISALVRQLIPEVVRENLDSARA